MNSSQKSYCYKLIGILALLINLISIVKICNAAENMPNNKISNSYLNRPTGAYHVGFKDYQLINNNACPNKFYDGKNGVDFSKNNVKKCDEIWLRIYYPTNKAGSSLYTPSSGLADDAKSANKALTTDEIKKLLAIRSFSTQNASIAKGKFPIILLSPGYGIPAQEYENIITNLVSHGYIIAGINSQFMNGALTLPNGHIVPVIQPDTKDQKKALFLNSLDDLSFTFDYLKNTSSKDNILKAINWSHIGLLGHSLGAGTVAHFADHDGIKAVASLDLTIDLQYGNNCHRDAHVPFMHMFSSDMYMQSKSGDYPYLCKDKKLNKDEYVVVLKNPNDPKDQAYSMHLNFVDYSTLQYHPVMEKTLNEVNKNPKQRFLGTGNGLTITNMINKKLLTFFDQYLKQSYKK